ncbi:MAG: sensor histidine kinase [Actinomycetota bacterium]|nr:sensor histidine kinase [Actinomycetota bacterium]
MDDTTHQPPLLSALKSWERWVNSFFVWMPYITLAVSVALAQLGTQDLSDRIPGLALALTAVAWTWLTFTRKGSPTRMAQGALQIYFIGFVAIAVLLMFRSPVYLVYGITGFFHASLLRPWSLAFLGIGAAGLIVHSHIVITEGTAVTWAIYLGVVAIQTVAVAAGLYGGHKISEIAEARREALERLETAMEENAGLHAQLVNQAHEAGIQDERQRMAREIHDTIAQGLTGVITQLEAVHQSWNDESEVRRRLETASELARESLAEARRSVQAIRPTPLDESRLPEALVSVASRWSETTGVPVQVHTTGNRSPLHPEVEVTLLRAAQEGLANVAKHAKASRVGVTLSFMDRSVTLDIRDDGVGFDPGKATREESYGLDAMRQRVEHVDGVMNIESAPGEGTSVSVRVSTGLIGTSHV